MTPITNKLPQEMIWDIAKSLPNFSKLALSVANAALQGILNQERPQAIKAAVQKVLKDLTSNITWIPVQGLPGEKPSSVIQRALQFLKNQGHELTESERGQALKQVALGQYKKSINLLLKNGPISEEDLISAIKKAVPEIGLHILQKMFPNGPESEEMRGLAVIKAAGAQKGGLVQSMLQQGPISNDHRKTALIEAVAKDDVNSILVLLRNGPVSVENMMYTIQESVPVTSLLVMQTLFPAGPPSVEMRGWAVFQATASKGRENFVQHLLNQGPISTEHGRATLFKAVQQDNVKIVQILLANGSISSQDRNVAKETARGLSHTDIVSAFNDYRA